jgi:sodium/proline symporter
MSFHDGVIVGMFLLYIVGMFAIGIIAYKRTNDLSDYLLGGRRLGAFVTALSAGASDMSGWLLLGLPGYAYACGYEASWLAIGLYVGTYLNWKLVAAPLRRATEALGDSLTLSDYLENRFADGTRLLRVVSAVFILIFFLFYTASGLVAGGKLFTSVFGLPYQWAVVLGVLAIILYTSVGGFIAVCWTDAVQGVLMLLALLAVPGVAIARLGGWAQTTAAMEQVSPNMLTFFTGMDGKPLTAIAIISLLGWGLGYCGQPHILTRFMAISSDKELPKARRIAMVWVGFSLLAALVIGMVGVASLPETLKGADSEKVFIVLVESMFHPVPAGVCLAAIMAAIMSTADSQLLVCTSVITEDFYKTFFRRDASQGELIWVSRVSVVVIAGCALLLALNPNNKVLDLVAYAWAGFGAAFGPTLVLSLYWKRMTRSAALAGIISGGLTVIVWKQLSGGIFDLYEIVPGFLLSALIIVVVTLLTAPKGKLAARG